MDAMPATPPLGSSGSGAVAPIGRAGLLPGRMTATVTEPMAVFMIGSRVNRLRTLPKWAWVGRVMPQLMAELAQDPDLGLLHVENFRRGRTGLAVQYWRSLDHLMAFAKDRDSSHLEAWRRFNRELREVDGIGIWHETYVVQPGQWEGMYVNMPAFGMGAALGATPIGPDRDRAAQRMAAR